MRKVVSSDSEAGLSLVELLVVITIFGVVGAIVTSGLIGAFRSSVETQTRIEARQELELTSQQIARVLRSADRILLGDDPGFVLGAQLSSATIAGNIFFGVEDDGGDERRLLECQGASADCLSDPGARQLIALIANELGDGAVAADPVFIYIDRDGETIPSDGSDPDRQPAGARVINIRLMRELSGERDPVVVETSVAVRSTRYFGSET